MKNIHVLPTDKPDFNNAKKFTTKELLEIFKKK